MLKENLTQVEEKIDAAMNQRNPKKVDYGGFA